MTLPDEIEDAIRAVVDEPQKPETHCRVVLPVSKATGWLMPGVDIARLSDLQEIEDLEYIQRMKQSE